MITPIDQLGRKSAAYRGMKRCGRCGDVKGLREFGRHKRSKDGRDSRCKPCHRAAAAEFREANADRVREYAAAYYAANTDKRRAYDAEYRAANPDKRRAQKQRRRATKRNATVVHFTERDVFRFWGEEFDLWGCYVCGAPVEHLDHWLPLSKGGAHSVENVLPACAAHNLEKHARHPLEYLHEKAPGPFARRAAQKATRAAVSA
ncbi:HNH endonuclease [Streptomyces diastaticus]